MALNLNGKSPKKILFNGLNVAKVLFNGVVVWMAKILQFLSGYPITLEKSTGENLVDYKIYGNQEPEAIILPDEYVRLDYIEGTGTQYIDTGLKTSGTKLSYEAKVKWNNNTSRQLFGANEGQYFGINSSGKYQFGHVGEQSTNILASMDDYDIIKADYHFGSDSYVEYSVNDENGTNERNFRSGLAISLFGIDKSYYSSASLKYFKIYINDSIVRDFIPCKNSEGKAGLYDLVENKFYGNSGTGDFAAGREITTELTNAKKVGDEYYKEGEQLYKIPIKVSNDTETEYEIYLNKPLGKIEENADYIDFENQEVAYYDYLTDTYTKENIELPEIPTQKGTNIITVETSLKPSKMSVFYYKEGGN